MPLWSFCHNFLSPQASDTRSLTQPSFYSLDFMYSPRSMCLVLWLLEGSGTWVQFPVLKGNSSKTSYPLSCVTWNWVLSLRKRIARSRSWLLMSGGCLLFLHIITLLWRQLRCLYQSLLSKKCTKYVSGYLCMLYVYVHIFITHKRSYVIHIM